MSKDFATILEESEAQQNVRLYLWYRLNSAHTPQVREHYRLGYELVCEVQEASSYPS